MTLGEIGEILQAKPIVEGSSQAWEIEIDRVYACDLMSDVLAYIKADSLLRTGLTNIQVIRTAEMADVAAICFVRGKTPQQEAVELAAARDLPLLTTDLTMYESCGRLYEKGLPGCDESK